jgi:hypothetical protein
MVSKRSAVMQKGKKIGDAISLSTTNTSQLSVLISLRDDMIKFSLFGAIDFSCLAPVWNHPRIYSQSVVSTVHFIVNEVNETFNCAQEEESFKMTKSFVA